MNINGLMQPTIVKSGYYSTEGNHHSASSKQVKEQENDTAATIEISRAGFKKAQFFHRADQPELDQMPGRSGRIPAEPDGLARESAEEVPAIRKENQSPAEKNHLEDVYHGSKSLSDELSSLLGSSATGKTETALGSRPADPNYPNDSLYYSIAYSKCEYMTLEELKKTPSLGYAIHGDSFESCLKDYEARKADIEKKCGHDEELLSAHLERLNIGLRHKFSSLALRLGKQMDFVRENGDVSGEHHKLAAHKDFNFKEFQQNAYNMMDEFCQAIIKLFDRGYNAADVYQSSIALMNEKYDKTTSVNNLSFSDYMVLQEYSLIEERERKNQE